MKNTTLKNIFLLVLLFSTLPFQAQYILEPKKGYTPQIGITMTMLEDLKNRIETSVENLNKDEVDFLVLDDANSIGALIFHLAATEKYYQVYTFEKRVFNEEETKKWRTALNLGDTARQVIHDEPIAYYLKIWDEVRQETLKLMLTKNDKWFKSKTIDKRMNNHYAWYHVMEHQSNHMGQIKFIKNRLIKK